MVCRRASVHNAVLDGGWGVADEKAGAQHYRSGQAARRRPPVRKSHGATGTVTERVEALCRPSLAPSPFLTNTDRILEFVF